MTNSSSDNPTQSGSSIPPDDVRRSLVVAGFKRPELTSSRIGRRHLHDPSRRERHGSTLLRRDVVLPKGKPAGETHAHSLEDITRMLNVLTEPASTIIAVAAFTGVRKGELRGSLWEN
jgi:hypothetical protein